MKFTAAFPLIFVLSASTVAFGQSTGMKSMDIDGMKNMDMRKCMEMKGMKGMDMKGMDMKGMDMKGMDMSHMDAQKCQDMMKNMDKKTSTEANGTAHKASAVVKEVDAANGKVTLAHGAVKSLGWPAMTMTFSVKEKSLFDKLVKGKKVHVEFSKEGSDYVINSVRS